LPQSIQAATQPHVPPELMHSPGPLTRFLMPATALPILTNISAQVAFAALTVAIAGPQVTSSRLMTCPSCHGACMILLEPDSFFLIFPGSKLCSQLLRSRGYFTSCGSAGLSVVQQHRQSRRNHRSLAHRSAGRAHWRVWSGNASAWVCHVHRCFHGLWHPRLGGESVEGVKWIKPDTQFTFQPQSGRFGCPLCDRDAGVALTSCQRLTAVNQNLYIHMLRSPVRFY